MQEEQGEEQAQAQAEGHLLPWSPLHRLHLLQQGEREILLDHL